MKRLSLIPVVLLLFAGTAVAQDEPTFERVLVPAIIAPTAGGYGSVWTSELYLFNGAGEAAQVEYAFGCIVTCPAGVLIEPNVAQEPPGLTTSPLSAPGMLFYVQRPFNEQFSFSLRVKDVSRQALTWGTEIPVIRERDTESATVELLNIPLDERFRQNIRFYDLDASGASVVHVRFFAMDGGAMLAEQDVTLVAPPSGSSRPLLPGYAIIDNVRAVPGLGATDRVRAEITPVTPGLAFWAFASVTNNETQHVTIITPQ